MIGEGEEDRKIERAGNASERTRVTHSYVTVLWLAGATRHITIRRQNDVPHLFRGKISDESIDGGKSNKMKFDEKNK